MITAECYTDRGGRPYNEDTCRYGQINGIFYALAADGLGGHGGGREASMAAAEVMESCLAARKAGRITREELAAWFAKANHTVLSMQTAECRMQTTMAALCIDGNRVVHAHLGDTRIYHFVDGSCAAFTFDHSVSRMAVLAREISMDQIRFHADRNKLLRTIGKSPDTEAETEEIVLAENRSHAFLLCTDGFWEYVIEEEMEKALAHSNSPKEWLDEMRAGLIKCAPFNNDNHSAAAVFVKMGMQKSVFT